MKLLLFRCTLLARFLGNAFNTTFLLDNKPGGIFLLVGLLLLTPATIIVGLAIRDILPISVIDTPHGQVILVIVCVLALVLLVVGVCTAGRIHLWPALLRLTPERFDAYADAIITTVHATTIAVRDDGVCAHNAPREAWTARFCLPSHQQSTGYDPFRSIALDQGSQAVMEAYTEDLRHHPWRQSLQHTLGRQATHIGILALQLRGDTTITVHVPALSAHGMLRLAARGTSTTRPSTLPRQG